MTIRTTGTLSSDITWTQIEEASLTKISDIGQVLHDLSLTDGTGNQQCDAIWHDVRTLSSGGSETLDFTDLTRILFDKDGPMSFLNVKGIIVKNRSEVAGDYLRIAATGTDGFDEPFDGGSGNVVVHPFCSIQLPNYLAGWDVSSTHKSITIFNAADSGVTYEVAVIGVTGTG